MPNIELVVYCWKVPRDHASKIELFKFDAMFILGNDNIKKSLEEYCVLLYRLIFYLTEVDLSVTKTSGSSPIDFKYTEIANLLC